MAVKENKNELLFSGEEILAKERKQKILIYACIGLGLMAILLTILLVIKGRTRASFQRGEGTLYPYGWQERSNGTVRLVIDRTAAPSYTWTVEGYDSESENNMVQLEIPEQKGKGSCEFVFHPVAEGRHAFTFILTDTDGFSRLAELNLVVESVQDEKKLLGSIVSSGMSVYFETVRGGENSAYPYAITMDAEGCLVLTIWDENLVYEPMPDVTSVDELIEQARQIQESELTTEEWEAIEAEEAANAEKPRSVEYFDWQGESSSNEILRYLGIEYGEKVVRAYFIPVMLGNAEIHIRSAMGGVEIVASVEINLNNEPAITAHNMQGYVADEATSFFENEEREKQSTAVSIDDAGETDSVVLDNESVPSQPNQ